MPIKLFARMRQVRGLYADLPQPLLGSQIGHALDEQRVFIGNGTPADGAPVIGNTELLTQYSPLLDLIEYTYESNTIEIPQTGFTQNSPTVRTLQQVLDDRVCIKAFPVLGDNNNDDSAGFNLAMLQLYCSGGLAPPAGAALESFRRIVFMPAGRYKMIANELIIPSRAHIVGEGLDSTVILLDSTSTLTQLFQTADSLGQTGTDIGTNGAELPTDIIIENLAIFTENFVSLGSLNRVSNIKFKNCLFMMGENYGGSPFTPVTPSITGTVGFAAQASAVGETIPSTGISINGTNVLVDASTTANGTIGPGNTVIPVSSTNNILIGMIVSDTTTSGAIQPGTTVLSINPGVSITLNQITLGTVTTGDTLTFGATLATVVESINNAAIPNITASAVLKSSLYYLNISSSVNSTLTINNTSSANLLSVLGLSVTSINGNFMFSVSKLGSNAIVMGGFTFEDCQFTNYYDVFDTSGCSGLNGVLVQNGFFYDAVNAPSFTNNAVNVNFENYSYNGLSGNVFPYFDNTSLSAGNVQNVATYAQPSITLAASQSDSIAVSFPLSAIGNGIFIDYTLIQSAAIRVGKLFIVTDGTNVQLGDDFYENNATDVTFDASVSGGEIHLEYTSSTASSLMRYSVEFWGNT